MAKRFVINEIRTKLTEAIKTEGFEYFKSKERIMRKHNTGFDVIYISIIDYNPIFQIESSVAIRLNAVEEIVNIFLDERFMNPEFKHLTTTISTSSYMPLVDDYYRYIEIKTKEDLNRAINEMINLIKDKGLLFFQNYRNFESTNNLKKSEILTKDNYGAYVLRNLMQSLTLMRLCNDPDFEKLSMKYKELYIPFSGEEETGRKAMDDLIEYLKKLD